MAKLGEANIGGRLVPAWLLDTPSSVLDGSYREFSATSKDETYESFCSRLDTLISTWPDRHYEVKSLYPPEIWGTGNLQLGWLVKHTKDYVVFTTLTNYDSNQCGWCMVKAEGVWLPLEWFNPPMRLGVEYRTTERYNGKPVYAFAMNLGQGPAQGETKMVSHNIKNIRHIVSYGGDITANGAQALSVPFDFAPARTSKGVLNADYLMFTLISVNIPLSGYTECYAWMKYTKTTD